ncbi:Bactericidal permeability-increasing protein, alpha/beta domain protein [Metarhizium album ARSEF 1941]|uniref:Bactericidal permeability-increasing protein, alpha/beta domain protein n=1 Tax=Metarhizium album (strain ARSEF 1941) TaxID=1081103 RepID=A0A0B2WV85_METAS|nr:Bactericidal permeability-increasing protein, alpha/beta domain protein [Metarhizium album ARSEF 1941]KHN97549.1 Bactericidal permeability-increasing protein, alpha/beta domain protein [Metarhizium album ARSEF 1941]
MSSCFGFCGSDDDDQGERQPLLPQYNQDTARQAQLHEKLHTYQMLRAMSNGYMPSNAQVMTHLRALLSSAVLNPPEQGALSSSGRALVRTARLWLQQLMDLAERKNSKDQLQDFIWYLSKAKLDVHVASVRENMSKSKARADASATVESLRTVASLAMLNRDFRVFVADVATIARQVLRDTALALGAASKEVGEKLDHPGDDIQALKKTDQEAQEPASSEHVKNQAKTVGETAYKEAVSVGEEAYTSVSEHMNAEAKDILMRRLRNAVTNLRKRTDYSESVSTLSRLLQKYLTIYLSVGSEAVDTLQGDMQDNSQVEKALHNFWLFLSSFGDAESWDRVRKSLSDFAEHNRTDGNLDEFVNQFANLVQEVLSKPEFFDNADERLDELRERLKKLTSGSSLGEDAGNLLKSVQQALESVAEDEDIRNMTSTSLRLIHILFPPGEVLNSDLVGDCINTFIPSLVQAVQYVPIPRLEVSTPAMDLLMENVIMQPGETVNRSSFLPYKLQLSTRNDVDITKYQFGTKSSVTSLVTTKLAGMSIAADDLGYWLRLHSGLLRFVDEGLASFRLDERGIDVTLDVEIARDRLDELVSLRGVRVKVHHLDYSLRKSKFSCLAWFLKPFLRPLLRKTLETQISSAMDQGLRTLNRELVFARERLRATRVCNPSDLWTFVRAVAARLMPSPDPDVYTRVGVEPGKGVFRGRYAPGSLVKVWEEEARDAEQNIFEYRQDGWRNAIFDLQTTPAS